MDNRARPGPCTPGRLVLPPGPCLSLLRPRPDLLTPFLLGRLPLHCDSGLRASRRAGGQRGPLPGLLTPLLRLPPSPDLSAAQPRAVSVLWSRVLASPLALFLSVSRECPPATFASLARNVPGAGAPYPWAPRRGSAPPSPGVLPGRGCPLPRRGLASGSGRTGGPEPRGRGPRCRRRPGAWTRTLEWSCAAGKFGLLQGRSLRRAEPGRERKSWRRLPLEAEHAPLQAAARAGVVFFFFQF